MIWISIALNCGQCILLVYFIWKTHKLKLKDWGPEIRGVDQAAHQRIDSMEQLWRLKWDNLRADVNIVSAKVRRFFSVK